MIKQFIENWFSISKTSTFENFKDVDNMIKYYIKINDPDFDHELASDICFNILKNYNIKEVDLIEELAMSIVGRG